MHEASRKIAEDTGDKLSIQLLKELCSTPVSAMELLAKYVDLDKVLREVKA